jgi:hypothetical protein
MYLNYDQCLCFLYLDEVGDADPENEMADWDCSSSRIPSRIESRVIELSGIILEWFTVVDGVDNGFCK